MSTKGWKGGLYFDAAGADGGTFAAKVGGVRNVTITRSKTEANVTDRSHGGLQRTNPVEQIVEISVEATYKPADAGQIALDDADWNMTSIGMQILDGDNDVDGVKGIQGDFHVTNITDPQPRDDAMTRTFTLKPADTAYGVQRVTISV